MKAPPPGVMVLIACMSVMLGLAAAGFRSAWRLAGDAPMSIHGWIAMGIAGVFSGALAGGLIWLAFYSARKGYDDDQAS